MDDVAQKRVDGMEAYKSYCAYTNKPIDLIPRKEMFELGTGIHKSLGTTIIRFPIDTFGKFLEYETDVIYADTPIIFGLDKMKQHKFCSYNQPEMKKLWHNHKRSTMQVSQLVETWRTLPRSTSKNLQ